MSQHHNILMMTMTKTMMWMKTKLHRLGASQWLNRSQGRPSKMTNIESILFMVYLSKKKAATASYLFTAISIFILTPKAKSDKYNL